MKDAYDFFLGGVIQGSSLGTGIEAQDYRRAVRDIVARKAPARTLYDPFEAHSSSVNYNDEEARAVFLHHIDLARHCRAFIAFLPAASLGTAIEMWECRAAGVPVIAITPMTHNWVVRLYSNVVLRDLAEFEEWLSETNLAIILDKTVEKRFMATSHRS